MKNSHLTIKPPLLALLMLALLGLSQSLTGQSKCDIQVTNPDEKEFLIFNGDKVDLINVDLFLSNDKHTGKPGTGGMAFLNYETIKGDITSGVGGCDHYFFSFDNGTKTPPGSFNNPPDYVIDTKFDGSYELGMGFTPQVNSNPNILSQTLKFDCSHLDGQPGQAKGKIFLLRIAKDDAGTDISSYVAIRIRTVQDHHPPMILCPADVVIDCNDPFDPKGIWELRGKERPAPYNVPPNYPALGDEWESWDDPATSVEEKWLPGVMDNCFIKSVTYKDDHTFDDNRFCYTIIRTWKVTDQSDNTATCTQRINVIDSEFPRFTFNSPSASNHIPDLDQCQFQEKYDMFMDACDTEQPFNPPVADNCDNDPHLFLMDEFRYEDISVPGLLGNPPNALIYNTPRSKYDYTVVKVYKLSDDCGNTIYRAKHITYRDTKAPVVATINGMPVSKTEDGTWMGEKTYPFNQLSGIPTTCPEAIPGPNNWFHNTPVPPFGSFPSPGADPAPYYGPHQLPFHFPPYNRLPNGSVERYIVENTYPPFWKTTKGDQDHYELANGNMVMVTPNGNCEPQARITIDATDCVDPKHLNGKYVLMHNDREIRSGIFSGLSLVLDNLEQNQTYMLLLTVFDPSGNSSKIKIPVVVKVDSPAANCEPAEVFLDNNGIYKLNWQDIDDESYDACDGLPGGRHFFPNNIAGSPGNGLVPESGITEFAIRIVEPASLATGFVVHHHKNSAGESSDPQFTLSAVPTIMLNCNHLTANVGAPLKVEMRIKNRRGGQNTCIREVTVKTNFSISLDLQGSNASAPGANDAKIVATASGGNDPYTYKLLPGGTTNNTGIFMNLPDGTYTVEASDGSSCVASKSITLGIDPPGLMFTLSDVSGVANSTLGKFVEVTVKNFNNIRSFDVEMVFSNGSASIPAGSTLQMVNPALANTSLNPATGKIGYFSDDLGGTSLPDGTLLFKIPVQLGPAATVAPHETSDLINRTAQSSAGPIGSTVAKGKVEISSTPPTRTIAGMIKHWDGCAVINASVKVTGTGVNLTPMTNNAGNYSTGMVVPDGINIQVMPTKGGYFAGGVINTADAMKIFQYAGNPGAIPNNSIRTASDIINDGGVNSLDAFWANQIFMGNEASLIAQANERPPWMFHAGNTPPADWNAAVPMINHTPLATDQPNDHFVGLKIGDVVGNSVNPGAGGNPNLGGYCGSPTLTSNVPVIKIRSNESAAFNIQDVILEAGKEYTIDFGTEAFTALGAMQFQLAFDQQALEFVEFIPGELENLSGSNYNHDMIADGKLLVGWFTYPVVTLEDGQTAFSLKFRAKNTVARLSKSVRVINEWTDPLAFREDGSAVEIAFNFTEVEQPEDFEFALMQNRPNPFSQATVIGFTLPSAASATLTVMDISGRVLRVIDGDFAKGYHEINLDTNDLSGSGVFYYQLATGQHTAVKKMILLE